ncbi:MAG: rubrerythrin family protein [Acidobacteriota bacterium]|nr:rubrerythrin family protein [Acidobacteriota bacterium]
MKKITENTLKEALSGESQAHLRYKFYAEQARKENLSNIARLFEAASWSEQVHATNYLKVLDGEGKTADNLDKAVQGETFEVEEMYPAYLAMAKEQGENKAATFYQFALAAEQVHASLYSRAKEAAAQGKDVELPEIYVCPVCGFTMEGESPERCPVCGAPKNKFVAF